MTSGFKSLSQPGSSLSTPAFIPGSPSWLEPNRRKAWPISTSRVNAFFLAPTDTSLVHRITWPNSLVRTCYCGQPGRATPSTRQWMEHVLSTVSYGSHFSARHLLETTLRNHKTHSPSPPHPLTSGMRAAMNSSCSADSFFTICMRHFKRGCGHNDNSGIPSCHPDPWVCLLTPSLPCRLGSPGPSPF